MNDLAFIEVDGVRNFRAAQLSPTASHLLYRSASPNKITPGGIQTLHDLHITTIFDLRSPGEVQKPGAVSEIEGIQRHHVPIFRDTDFSPEATAIRYRAYASEDGIKGFVKAYTDILESAGPAFRPVFEFLRDADSGEKFLVHCTAGKDRTGLLCALVLMLAGGTDEQVAQEYHLTEMGLREWKVEMIERLMQIEVLLEDRKGVERMVSANVETMLAVIGMIREKYGGVERYMTTKCGFKDEDIYSIRKKLTQDG